jgi:hypothetical protein
MNKNGFVSAQTLIIVLTLLAFSYGTAALLLDLQFLERIQSRFMFPKKSVAEELEKIVSYLNALHEEQNYFGIAEMEDFSLEFPGVRMKDISSQINLNTVRRNIFTKTNLAEKFSSDPGPDQLQAFRVEEGLSVSWEWYEDFVKDLEYPHLYTTYGVFNPNIMDEFVIEWAGNRISDEVGTEMREAWLSKLSQKKFLDNDEVMAIAGEEFEDLWQVVPVWNCNFSPSRNS